MSLLPGVNAVAIRLLAADAHRMVSGVKNLIIILKDIMC